MTEPDDETTQHPAASTPAGSDASLNAPPTAPPEPPPPPTMPVGPVGEPSPPPPPPVDPSTEPTPTSPPTPVEPPLAADPHRPADPGWREPPWIPPRPRDRRPSTVALIVGVALIAVGVWFFLDRTLGINLPTIEWRSIWPILLIVLGAIVLIRSLNRSR
ncbi:MAG TPA: DUF5668 domain-containing protein [Phytomonospora sp.]